MTHHLVIMGIILLSYVGAYFILAYELLFTILEGGCWRFWRRIVLLVCMILGGVFSIRWGYLLTAFALPYVTIGILAITWIRSFRYYGRSVDTSISPTSPQIPLQPPLQLAVDNTTQGKE